MLSADVPLAPKAIDCCAHTKRRDGPTTDSCIAATASLFDHLVGAGEQHRWHNDAKRLRGLQIDHQLELGSAACPEGRPAVPPVQPATFAHWAIRDSL